MKRSNLKIKLVCGFKKDQEYTIDMNEAHKAYYLFNHPEKRGTFDSGLAIRGADIQRIVPDYNATMGWHHSHQLTDEDHLQLNQEGIAEKFEQAMATAREVARNGILEELRVPLVDLHKGKYAGLKEASTYAQKLLDNQQ